MHAYEMYKCMNFYHLVKRTQKRYQILAQTCLKFHGCHGIVENDGHTIDISKECMNRKENFAHFL